MRLESPAFVHHGDIPSQHTCQGADRAPTLRWSDVPAGTRSLALVVDDPDAPDPRAPKQTWVHWLVYNLPPDGHGLDEGGALPVGARTGRNDWKKQAWGGPCPPIGKHRYFFKLYALDRTLPDLVPGDKAQLEAAMQGHVLGQAELVGLYEKHR
jgi:Raf kinase inhibitor-like YbhB/YbcL family protein